MFSFFFYCYRDHLDLHSFPTRRSSDLVPGVGLERGHPGECRARPARATVRAPPDAAARFLPADPREEIERDRKSTRLNSSHQIISYAVFCLKKKNTQIKQFVCIFFVSD